MAAVESADDMMSLVEFLHPHSLCDSPDALGTCSSCLAAPFHKALHMRACHPLLLKAAYA
eukprot:2646008-Rhodomonas_salina.2